MYTILSDIAPGFHARSMSHETPSSSTRSTDDFLFGRIVLVITIINARGFYHLRYFEAQNTGKESSSLSGEYNESPRES